MFFLPILCIFSQTESERNAPFHFYGFSIFCPGIQFGMALTSRKDSLPSESEYESFIEGDYAFNGKILWLVPILQNQY